MAAKTAMAGIQEAMFTTMTNDTTLMGMITGVFDEVPEGTPKPYVVIGEAIETPRNAHNEFGRETVVTLHIWSTHAGFTEANDILDELLRLFDHQPLTVTGQTVVSLRYEFSQTLRDPEPRLRHVPVRFRVTTEAQ